MIGRLGILCIFMICWLTPSCTGLSEEVLCGTAYAAASARNTSSCTRVDARPSWGHSLVNNLASFFVSTSWLSIQMVKRVIWHGALFNILFKMASLKNYVNVIFKVGIAHGHLNSQGSLV